MRRQSFLGTTLTLRYFWQSDYESLCSSVVGAIKWTKSPTAVRTWLAAMLQDEEWAAYIKLVSSLLMDSLSASWQCQDCIRCQCLGSTNGEHAFLNYREHFWVGWLLLTVCFPELLLAIPQSQLFSLEYWPEIWHLICDIKNYLNYALILFLKNSFIIYSFTQSAATLVAKD